MFFPVDSPLFWYSAVGAYAGSLFFYLFQRERPAMTLLFAGFVVNALFLIGRSLYWGLFIPTNMFAETYFLPWCLVLLVSLLWLIGVDKKSVLSGGFPILFFSLMALFFPVESHPPSAQHDTVLVPLFFITEVMAHACFILGGWLAFWGMVKKVELPIFNTLLIWGFVLYSLAQIIGGMWAFLGWGAPFHWSERHLQSASLWCFYCAYLHLHFSSKWKLNAKMRFAVVGPIMIIVFSLAYHIK